MVGDGHAMGVAAEILQHILGATEGTSQVDDPVLSKQWPEPSSEDLGFGEELQVFGVCEHRCATLRAQWSRRSAPHRARAPSRKFPRISRASERRISEFLGLTRRWPGRERSSRSADQLL